MSYNSTHTGAQIDAAIDAVETKQDRLVSGTNIKTINGQSIMGSGNLSIEATGTYECTYDVTTYSDVVAAIQAGKTPIVKIDDSSYVDIFTLSEWDIQGEILSFNGAYMAEQSSSDDGYSISVSGVLLKNTPDSSTTSSGWSETFFKQIVSPVEIHSATCASSASSATKTLSGDRQNFTVVEGTLFFIRFSSGNTYTSGTCNLKIDNATGLPDYNYPLKWRGGALPTFAADTVAIVVFNAASSIFELVGFDDQYTKAEIDTKLSAKQDTLTSGTNIKTVNNTSLLGSGNISIGGSSTYFATCASSASDSYKYITLDNYSPAVGATIAVQFTNGSTSSSAKLFINNANDHWMTIDTSTSIPTDLIKANSVVTVMNTGSFFKILSVNNVAQEKLVSGTNIKTVNGNSLLGSGNIEIQGGGGGDMPLWETITTSTGTASKSFDLSTYNEIMIVADILRNSAHHLYSVTLPVECLYDTAYEVKLSGGYVSSSVNTAAFYNISKTSGAGVSAYINGTSYISSTTWKVFGRTNFSAANFMSGPSAPASSTGNDGDLFLRTT